MPAEPDYLDLVNLRNLMQSTSGRRDIVIGMIDGPVASDHPELTAANLRLMETGACSLASSPACFHGTFVAGILVGRRASTAPAICPDCTLLVYPLFSEQGDASRGPKAVPAALGAAIKSSVDFGARVLNLSVGINHLAGVGRELRDAMDYAARKGSIIVVAAGNQASTAVTDIACHPAVIPVAGCDRTGRPTEESNLGATLGHFGLAGPGRDVVSLSPDGGSATMSGTSTAAPFVAGAAALLWSEFPRATAAEIRYALIHSAGTRRTIIPPLLNAFAAWEMLAQAYRRRN